MKLIGTVESEPDVRFDMNGVIHVTFDVRVKDTLVECEFKGDDADAFAWEMHPFALVGTRVALRGGAQTRRWRDRDGRPHVRTYFRIDALACRLPGSTDPKRFGGDE